MGHTISVSHCLYQLHHRNASQAGQTHQQQLLQHTWFWAGIRKCQRKHVFFGFSFSLCFTRNRHAVYGGCCRQQAWGCRPGAQPSSSSSHERQWVRKPLKSRLAPVLTSDSFSLLQTPAQPYTEQGVAAGRGDFRLEINRARIKK